MIYESSLRYLWKAVSDHDSRYALQAVKLDTERRVLVATDGHMLSVVDADRLIEKDEGNFLIPRDALIAADGFYRKQNAKSRIPIYIRKDGGAVVVNIGLSKREQRFPAISGDFPKWPEVIPKDLKSYGKCVTLNASRLLALTNTLQTEYRGVAREPAVELLINGTEKPIVVRVNGCSLGIMMPMRNNISAWDRQPRAFWEGRTAKAIAPTETPAEPSQPAPSSTPAPETQAAEDSPTQP